MKGYKLVTKKPKTATKIVFKTKKDGKKYTYYYNKDFTKGRYNKK